MLKHARKRKTIDPCPTCFLHRQRCICLLIPHLDLQTKVSLVIHAKELKRTTNTGRLALHALVNSAMYVRGDSVAGVELSHLLSPDYQSYVLFPSPEAIELDSLMRNPPSLPIHLIVSDGNWRQAAKINTRHPELKHLPRVKISASNLAQQHLRKEHFPEGLSTLEAIALALGVIEGEAAGESLTNLYLAKLNATLAGRSGLVSPPIMLK